MGALKRTKPYWQALPSIMIYQVVTKLGLFAVLRLLNELASWALASQGRVAVTTGDWMFLFTSWQGWVLILLGITVLYACVAFDLCALIAFSGHYVRGEDIPLMRMVTEGLTAMGRLICPAGAAIVLYVALISPISGVGLSISLTEQLHVPNFVAAVIEATPLYRIAYYVLLVVFALIGFFGIYSLHGIVLSKESVRTSRKRSRALMQAHWLDFLKQSILFAFGMLLCAVFILVVLVAIIVVLTLVLRLFVTDFRYWIIFTSLVSSVVFALVSLALGPLQMIKMTQLYLEYTGEDEVVVPVREGRRRTWIYAVGSLVLLGCAVASYGATLEFDTLFPREINTLTIAHRAAGSEGPENTAEGVRIAADLGAWGSEMDIQRTSDGHYVVNHDNTFERTTGDARKPGELTLDEACNLTIVGDATAGSEGVHVSSYEDMLEAARDRVTLFVELKGSSADRKMADDAIRIAQEADMLDQCVFISLDYQLIDYLETTYPDAKTGFLTFAGYGDVAALNCDYLALEEQAATGDAIDAVHEQGKRVFVWTVNDPESQRYFLQSDADAIITDNVSQAAEIVKELEARDDIDRIQDKLLLEL